MSLATDAAKAVAAEQRHAAETQSAESYRQAAQAAIDRRRVAEEASSRDIVIVNGQHVEPGAAVPAVQPAKSVEATPAPTSQHLTPLPALGDRQPIAASDLLKQMRANGAAAEALRSWPTADADMPFAAGPMAMVVNNMPKDDADLVLGALAEVFDLRPSVQVTFMRGLTVLGRQAAAVAGDPGSFTTTPATTKGTTMAEFEFTGSPAQLKEQLAELEETFHDAYWRGDRVKAARIAEKRRALSAYLHPGSTEPDADHKQVIG